MNYTLNSRYEQMTLCISVQVARPIKLRLKVVDRDKPLTAFTNRYKTVESSYKFYVRLPMTPKTLDIQLSDDDGSDITNYVRVLNIEKLGLEKRMDEVDFNSYSVGAFVDFAQKFSFNASYLETNNYVSELKDYKIEYLPTIINSRGMEMQTPARISKSTGRIQVSKKLFKDYTVPMRMAILLHEFSHFYLNEDIDDEVEADLNGLLIYLGLGYPRIDGYEAFLQVFETTPTPQNKNRYDIINRFISDFDNKKFVMY
jgi:hypothetical protein